MRDGKVDSWDYSWTANVWYKGGLTATPNVNLVSNIGFGEDATHTKSFNEQESSTIPCLPLKKVTHPKIIKIDNEADIFDFEWTFGGRNLRFPRRWILIPKKIFNFVFKKNLNILNI